MRQYAARSSSISSIWAQIAARSASVAVPGASGKRSGRRPAQCFRRWAWESPAKCDGPKASARAADQSERFFFSGGTPWRAPGAGRKQRLPLAGVLGDPARRRHWRQGSRDGMAAPGRQGRARRRGQARPRPGAPCLEGMRAPPTIGRQSRDEKETPGSSMDWIRSGRGADPTDLHQHPLRYSPREVKPTGSAAPARRRTMRAAAGVQGRPGQRFSGTAREAYAPGAGGHEHRRVQQAQPRRFDVPGSDARSACAPPREQTWRIGRTTRSNCLPAFLKSRRPGDVGLQPLCPGRRQLGIEGQIGLGLLQYGPRGID